MKAAPAVLIDLRDPERSWRRAQQALGLLVLSGLLAWFLSHLVHGTRGWPLGLALVVTACGLGLAGPLLRPTMPRGQLAWNGAAWHWREGDDPLGAPQGVRVHLALDLGAWVLIAMHGADARTATQWLPVSRAQAGAAWHGLQVALRQGGPHDGPATATVHSPPPHP